jgi:class 3 adenylate cyclase/tetratricopeptide (TPR) repeat protein
MSAVADWLDSIGLGKYAAAFETNEVSMGIVGELTDDDLREMGLPMGPRRTLLKAAATTLDVEPDEKNPRLPTTNATSGDPTRTAERRQITVMFCDLVGSTALSEQLDPEDLRTLMQAYQKTAGAIMRSYGGHVAQYLGDGLMTYFGWPRAHEDDAERAVLAALDVVEAVKMVAASHPLKVRIGVATGPVVVGETGDGDAAVPKLAVGETPNLAARLQDLAEADEIIVASGSHRVIGGAIVFEDMGEHTLRGIVEPVHAWKALERGQTSGRFEAAHSGPLARFIGRESEIAILLDRWRLACEGEGQMVMLCGEPGIGKSRIIEELRRAIADEKHLEVSYQCSSRHRSTALFPIADYFARMSDFDRHDTSEEKLDKLDSLIAYNELSVGEVAPLFAASLGIPTGDRYSPLQTTPHRLREKIAEALVMRGVELSKHQPLLVVIEDIHWIDPTTEEAMDLFADYCRDMRALLIATYRPEYDPAWLRHSHVTQLTLNRLGKRNAASIIDQVSSGKTLPDTVLEQVIAKADGVPLFVEELTRTVLESGLLVEGDAAYALAGPLPELAIPMTLHDSLMARLDRLAPVRDLVQIGSVIGRDFSRELLGNVSSMDEGDLDEALEAMVDSGLVFVTGVPPDTMYSFKHMLIQETAYNALLKSRLQQLHAKIAGIYEIRFKATSEGRPENIASHYSAGGSPEKALPYWLLAGERAVEASANSEAINHLRQGLELIETMTQSPDRDRQELIFLNTLSTPLIAIRGYADEETGRTHTRARDLSERLGENELPFPAMYGQCVSHTVVARHQEAREVAVEFLRLAEEHDDIAAKITGHRLIGLTDIYLGEPGPARSHLDLALDLHDPEHHEGRAYHFAQDPFTATLVLRSWSLLLLGFEDQSAADRERALNSARDLGHAHTLAYCLFYVAILQNFVRGDVPAVADASARLATLCEQQAMVTWLPFANAAQGWVQVKQGDPVDGTAAIASVVAAREQEDGSFATTLLLAMLAEGQTRLGQDSTAMKTLSRALDFADQSSERWMDADLLRRKGELEAEQGDWDAAVSTLESAVAIARKQQAAYFGLRAALALARIWSKSGKEGKAADLLKPITEDYSEGLSGSDLLAAKMLLDSLSS